MVFAAPASPFVYAPPPMAAAVTHGVGSGTHIGNIPSHIVPSTIVTPEVQNNRQGTPLAANYGQTGTVNTFTAPPNLLALAPPAATPNHSVAFFAQLLAQSDPSEQLTLTQTFRDPVPFKIMKPEVMEAYSNVKYLPSNAAKPSAPKPGIEVMQQAETKPHTVYTRKYQIAQRYQTDVEQIKVDVNKLMQGVSSRETTAASSSAAGSAAATDKSIRRTEPTTNTREPQRSPNNMVYQAPTVNYGGDVKGVNAYLSAISLFNPPPTGPVLRTL